MRAKEARIRTQGHNIVKKSGLAFKMGLAWWCGIVNRGIEKAIKNGKYEYTLKLYSEESYNKYSDSVSKIYRNLGYSVFHRCNTVLGKYCIDISWRDTD